MGQDHCSFSKALRKAAIAALVFAAAKAASGQSDPVTLRWDANLEPDIAGYRLYYGTDPHAYTATIDVGNAITATVSDLRGGIVYFFAVTAYNTAGFESLFSNPVAYTAPAVIPLPLSTPTPIPTAPPLLNVTSGTVTFTAIAGGSSPAPQRVHVKFSAAGLPDKEVGATLTVAPAPSPGLIVQDDFDRTNGELGPNWTMDPTWGSGLSISANKVVATTVGGSYWNANTFGADQYSQIRLTGAVGSWRGVIVRGNLRPAPFYLATVRPSGADLYSWSNGAWTRLAHDDTGWATGDVVRLEVWTLAQTTAHLTVYRNGIELLSYDDPDSFIAGGQPGIALRAGTGGMSLDDWEGGSVP